MAISLGKEHSHYRHYLVNLGTLYQKKQVRTYTGFILSLLAIAFFSFFAIRPTLITIASLIKEIDSKQMIAEKLEEKINALSHARSEYIDLSSSLPLIEEALPQEPNLSLFIRQLETLAVQNGVILRSIQFGEISLRGEKISKSLPATTKEIESPQIPFNLSVSGSYKNLKNFLQSLEELRRLTVVSSFIFKMEKEKEGQFLVLSVTGETFYLNQNKSQ
jgi:Tfp pilus assembly protein PilO